MQKKLYYFIVLLAIGTLQCSTHTKLLKFYSGADLPESEICFLVKPGGVVVASLDGATGGKSALGGNNALVGMRGTKILELKPGQHTFHVGINITIFHSGGRRTTVRSRRGYVGRFTGQAGHIYMIKPDPYKNYHAWRPYISDITGTSFAQQEIIPAIREQKSKSKK
ncbi:MAG: hypothetical protein SWH54_17560 [Thermodesulfobacteriota bacterium]|nr:hypothetical protein [Thermodesulfobacteriota bacterium]